MKTLSIIMLMLTIMFITTSHPLSMGLILIIQTIFVALTTGLMTMTFWFSFIIFIIMVGSMMVLFLYMTSITANEKFTISWKMIFSLIPLMLISYNMSFNSMNININLLIMKYFLYPNNLIMIMIMAFLFITLVAVVKTTKTNFGALRQY